MRKFLLAFRGVLLYFYLDGCIPYKAASPHQAARPRWLFLAPSGASKDRETQRQRCGDGSRGKRPHLEASRGVDSLTPRGVERSRSVESCLRLVENEEGYIKSITACLTSREAHQTTKEVRINSSSSTN